MNHAGHCQQYNTRATIETVCRATDYVIETTEPRQTIQHFGASDAWSMQFIGLWDNEEEQQKMLNNFLSTTKGTPLEFYSETLSENQNKASYYMYDGNTINQTQQGNNF